VCYLVVVWHTAYRLSLHPLFIRQHRGRITDEEKEVMRAKPFKGRGTASKGLHGSQGVRCFPTDEGGAAAAPAAPSAPAVPAAPPAPAVPAPRHPRAFVDGTEEWLPTGRRYTFPDEGALTRGGAGLIVFDTMIPPPGSLVGLEGAVVLITVRKTPGTRTTGSGRKRAMRNDNQRIFREQEPPALALGRRRGDAAMFYIYRHYT
jgi:hypothetical protein